MLKVYEYKNCGTCQKALKFLDEKKVAYQKIPIREQPPTEAEIRRMLGYVGDIKKLFNTSGQDYQALGIKDKPPSMTTDQVVKLLAKTGNLIKRPFVLSESNGWVGFKEEVWKEILT